MHVAELLDYGGKVDTHADQCEINSLALGDLNEIISNFLVNCSD